MSTTLKLTTKQVYEAKNLFDEILSQKLFPSFVANNVVTLQNEIDKLNKESKVLTDTFSIENGQDMQGNKLFKQFVYVSLDNGLSIAPYLKDSKETEHSEEVVKEIEEGFTEDDKKQFEQMGVTPRFFPYPVEPSRFKEYVTEQEVLFSKENEIGFFPLKNEAVEKAELDGKLDNATEILIKLKLLGYYV